MRIANHDIDFTARLSPLVIAEIGVNHNGSIDLARRLIDAARESGADVAKFQVFRAELEISRHALMAPYQQENVGAGQSQLDLVKGLELDLAALRAVKAHCDDVGIAFFASAFDPVSVDVLIDELGARAIKLGSGEITNLPLLAQIASRGVAMILSTGASTLAEVGVAVDAVRAAGDVELVLLHCVSSYPAPIAEVNLHAMATLRTAFGLPVGYSDHTLGISAATAAAALGACCIEKHLTLDRQLPGPDHAASAEPAEFAALVRAVREAALARGDGKKRPTAAELPNLPLIRKSLVTATALPAGTVLTPAMIGIKRPLGGLPPQALHDVVGRRLRQDMAEDEQITAAHLL